MASIKMPVTPRTAYNPKRSANILLLTQVRELEKAVSAAGRRVRRKKPKTEEQVAAYLRHLNRALHQQLLLPPMKRRPLDVPLVGLSPSGATPKRSRKRSASSLSRKKRVSTTPKPKRSRRS
jgi:hypothetical protein